MPSESLHRPMAGPDLPMEPGPAFPLGGLVVLAVEDSRYASDALRLCLHRLGARLRRAETIAAALAHLERHRPDVVLVDHGLPDGDGAGLVARLSVQPDRPVLVGHSGDDGAAEAMLAAGADAFLPKPLPGLAALCDMLAALLPDRGFRTMPSHRPLPRPDPLALRDDLLHAQGLLQNGLPDAARFVATLAAAAGDGALAAAARAPSPVLARLVQARLERLARAGPA